MSGPMVRLRPKSQLTLPDEVRQALGISEGDMVEFEMQADGSVAVSGWTLTRAAPGYGERIGLVQTD